MTETAFDRIVRGLEHCGVQTKGNGDKMRAQCPVHDSRGLTLSIRRVGDRATVHCFAGCLDTDVLEAIGLSVRDLFDEPGAARSTRPVTVLGPLGDVDHFLERMQRQQQLEADPAYQRRRAQELAEARRPRPGDFVGGGRCG